MEDEEEMRQEILYGLIVASCIDGRDEIPEWMSDPHMRKTLRKIYNFLIDGDG